MIEISKRIFKIIISLKNSLHYLLSFFGLQKKYLPQIFLYFECSCDWIWLIEWKFFSWKKHQFKKSNEGTHTADKYYYIDETVIWINGKKIWSYPNRRRGKNVDIKLYKEKSWKSLNGDDRRKLEENMYTRIRILNFNFQTQFHSQRYCVLANIYV